jgi:hypothetical protein
VKAFAVVVEVSALFAYSTPDSSRSQSIDATIRPQPVAASAARRWEKDTIGARGWKTAVGRAEFCPTRKGEQALCGDVRSSVI